MSELQEESTEKVINILDDTPETIERVLSFLYLKDYSEDGPILQYRPIPELTNNESHLYSREKARNTEPENTELRNQSAFTNIEVFIAADKYGIIPLKTLATLKFSRWANTSCGSPVFDEVIEKVMTSVPSHEPTLQEVIADVFCRHILDLIEDPEIVHTLDSFGYLGSLVIARLVGTGMVKRPNESDIFQGLVQKINSSRRCRHCLKDFNVSIKGAEYLYEVFRCASCNTRN
ncbi:hypothetical protein PENSUB_578 [Penicillium subrubescens]|uniref:BTB domain-containing protein n=1 Tax=Penicillium subrubescens TaxID=1316194 RepID=A0A1Q5UML8_9EURO|nr:hypothetical protein PENSUB_578 [Penicillium subrubescens]